MVKKRNHYIPQFLLRRFASRQEQGRSWLWQFRPGQAPTEVVTKDAAVSKFFYGDPETGIEESLAVLEGKQASLLRELDSGANPSDFDQHLLRFVWFLAFRTRSLRHHFAHTAKRGLAELASIDQAKMASLFAAKARSEPDSYILPILDRLPPSLAHLRTPLLALLRSKVHQDEFLQEIAKAVVQVPHILAMIANQAEEAAAKGQVRALKQILDESWNVPTTFRIAQWSVRRFASSSVILGDGGTFAINPAGEVGTVGRFSSTFTALYAPISHECVLIGHRDECPPLSLNEINAASARLSFDTFFASRNTAAEQAMVNLVGTGEPVLSEDDIQRVVAESWGSLAKETP